MSCWGKSQQVCATCRYWSGRREIDFTASHFTALEQIGMCNGPQGSFRGVHMGEGSYCPQWEQYRE
jgi:hypothetical protein